MLVFICVHRTHQASTQCTSCCLCKAIHSTSLQSVNKQNSPGLPIFCHLPI